MLYRCPKLPRCPSRKEVEHDIRSFLGFEFELFSRRFYGCSRPRDVEISPRRELAISNPQALEFYEIFNDLKKAFFLVHSSQSDVSYRLEHFLDSYNYRDPTQKGARQDKDWRSDRPYLWYREQISTREPASAILMSRSAAGDQSRKTFRSLSSDTHGPIMSSNFKRVRRFYRSVPTVGRASDDEGSVGLVTEMQFRAQGEEISRSSKPGDSIQIRPPSDEKDLVVQQSKPLVDPAAVPAVPHYWSHHLYKAPSGKAIIVHYCKSLQKSEDVAKLFLNDKVIGFDMEWKPQATKSAGIRSNVSLIQIANSERIALFQIALFKPAKKAEDFVAASLRKILESPDTMKVGVTIKADCTRLRKYLGVDTRGTFELSHLYKLVKYSESNPKLINKRPVSLSDQIEEHFGMPLAKDSDVRCSNWAKPLNYRQIQYAATDPYACLRLFDTMDTKRKSLDPMPPLPEYAELDLPIRLAEAVTVENEAEAKTGADDTQTAETAIEIETVVIKSELTSVTCTA